MTPSQKKIEALLQQFATSCNTTLHLKEGVCALYNTQGHEAAVLEVPDQSDCLLFHCQLINAEHQAGQNFYALLLQLNFEMSAMRGCWLAIDENHIVRLCFQQTISQIDETSFGNLITGFITQAEEVREFITHITEHDVA
ncbi:type III secretion system chaperone [Pantoea stewartii]|uniref:type III secretion system chaperone n=1 Tax=Pantoea stewartii TaxID=66269 RepID=UPI001561C88B|nr:type III secretion system chaperone [Pantoea stewartii]NRH24866.1 hypothetical protein [Pantoea stewartii]